MSDAPILRPWEADRPLVVEDVEAIVAHEGLRGPVEPLGEGWDYQAFRAGGDVLRFAKRAEVVPQMTTEERVLRFVAPRVPVAVPALTVLPPVLAAIHGYTRHVELPGRPLLGLDVDRWTLLGLVDELGRAIAALHATPVAAARAHGVETCAASSPVAAARRSLARLKSIAPRLPRESVAVAERVMGAPPERAGGEPVLAHADLWPEHLLVDEASLSLTGIIDWGDVQLGDPADDYAAAWFLAGEEGLQACLDAAQVRWSEPLARRTRFWGVHHAIGSAWYGLEMQSPERVLLSLDVLARLA